MYCFLLTDNFIHYAGDCLSPVFILNINTYFFKFSSVYVGSEFSCKPITYLKRRLG